MIKVVYGRNGQPISDFEVYDFVDSVIESYIETGYNVNYTVNISNELCLMVFGLRMLEGKIPINEVELYFEDIKLEFDPILGIKDPTNCTLGFYADVAEKAIVISYELLKNKKGI